MVSNTIKTITIVLGLTYCAGQVFSQDYDKHLQELDNASLGAAVVREDGHYWIKENDGWQQHTPDGFVFKELYRKPELTKTTDVAELLEKGARFHPNGYGVEDRNKIVDFRKNLPGIQVLPYDKSRSSIDGIIAGPNEYRLLVNGLEYAWNESEEIEEWLKDSRLDSCEITKGFCADSTMFVFPVGDQ